jgi:protein O-GlcNAc transferase
LFDTALLTRHLELAYIAVHERHRTGLSPDHISIAE